MADDRASEIALLREELADLEHALADADDGAQATRLGLMISSRRARLDHLQREGRG